MELQKKTMHIPDVVTAAKVVALERRIQIDNGIAKNKASTGTDMSKLHGMAKTLAQLANIGDGSIESGGGGVAEGIKRITELAQAEAFIAGHETKGR